MEKFDKKFTEIKQMEMKDNERKEKIIDENKERKLYEIERNIKEEKIKWEERLKKNADEHYQEIKNGRGGIEGDENAKKKEYIINMEYEEKCRE